MYVFVTNHLAMERFRLSSLAMSVTMSYVRRKEEKREKKDFSCQVLFFCLGTRLCLESVV